MFIYDEALYTTGRKMAIQKENVPVPKAAPKGTVPTGVKPDQALQLEQIRQMVEQKKESERVADAMLAYGKVMMNGEEKKLIKTGMQDVRMFMVAGSSQFSAIYLSRETLLLDIAFGLTGDKIVAGSEAAQRLSRATAVGTFGNREIEATLRCFAEIARMTSRWAGVREDELLTKWTDQQRQTVDFTLRYEDGLMDGAVYLKRIGIDGKNILFPVNIPYIPKPIF